MAPRQGVDVHQERATGGGAEAVAVRVEGPSDPAQIRAVHVAAFGGEAEARLVELLRAGGGALRESVEQGSR